MAKSSQTSLSAQLEEGSEPSGSCLAVKIEYDKDLGGSGFFCGVLSKRGKVSFRLRGDRGQKGVIRYVKTTLMLPFKDMTKGGFEEKDSHCYELKLTKSRQVFTFIDNLSGGVYFDFIGYEKEVGDGESKRFVVVYNIEDPSEVVACECDFVFWSSSGETSDGRRCSLAGSLLRLDFRNSDYCKIKVENKTGSEFAPKFQVARDFKERFGEDSWPEHWDGGKFDKFQELKKPAENSKDSKSKVFWGRIDDPAISQGGGTEHVAIFIDPDDGDPLPGEKEQEP